MLTERRFSDSGDSVSSLKNLYFNMIKTRNLINRIYNIKTRWINQRYMFQSLVSFADSVWPAKIYGSPANAVTNVLFSFTPKCNNTLLQLKRKKAFSTFTPKKKLYMAESWICFNYLNNAWLRRFFYKINAIVV